MKHPGFYYHYYASGIFGIYSMRISWWSDYQEYEVNYGFSKLMRKFFFDEKTKRWDCESYENYLLTHLKHKDVEWLL